MDRLLLLEMFTSFPQATSGTIAAVLILLILFRKLRSRKCTEQDQKLPPHIPSPVPYLGHAVEYGKNPIDFLLKAYKKYGSVFSFTMVGKTFTVVIGPRPCAVFFNSKNENLNAEGTYASVFTPVLGKGVAYDVPNKVSMEQKKWMKPCLLAADFHRYVPLIEKETNDYFERWGDSGERDLFAALSELFIFTASRCLHGKDILERLDEHVIQLYNDLIGGFSHLAWLLPGWLPLPSFRKRDKAQLEIKDILGEIIRKRRETPDGDCENDFLKTLIRATYKDGRQVSNDEITGLLILTLITGQHTTSTPSSWLGFFLARERKFQEQAFAEQITVRGEELLPLEYDQLKQMEFLDRCLKEALRLRPPATIIPRLVKTPQVIQGFTVPAGHYICASPLVNHSLEELWEKPDIFNPDRFLDTNATDLEKFAYVPFGAGLHRCIGQSFALMQIKTVWSVLLQKYDFDLVDGHFPTLNYSNAVHVPTKHIIKYKRRITNEQLS